MNQNNQPIFANLNLASLYKIELSCQRFINLGNRVVKIGSVLNQNKGTLAKKAKKKGKSKNDDIMLFARQIFGPNFEQQGSCLCGYLKHKNPHIMQALIRDNEKVYWNAICGQCLMEYMDSDVQMSRMGLIDLPSNVLHVWYITYLARLFMCNNDFIFRSIYGGKLTIVQLAPEQIKFASRKGAKSLILDGDILTGIIFSRSSDRSLKYDVIFVPKNYMRLRSDPDDFIFNTLLPDLTDDLRRGHPLRSMDLPIYHDVSFEKFLIQLKHNQYVGFDKYEITSQSAYKKLLKDFGLRTLKILKKLRQINAMPAISSNPLILYTGIDLMDKETYFQLYYLVSRYKLLMNWINLSFFKSQTKERFVTMQNIYKIDSILQGFKEKKSIIIDFLAGLEGRYNISTITVSRGLEHKIKRKTTKKRRIQKIVRGGKIIKFIDKKQNKQWSFASPNQLENNISNIDRLRLKSFFINKKIRISTRYAESSKMAVFCDRSIGNLPNLLLRDFEKNWVYDYKKVTHGELQIIKTASIYNNYWEISSQPTEKLNRNNLILFFTANCSGSFAELDTNKYPIENNYETAIYEKSFLENPTNVWHNLHLLPFNLKARSHTAWKEVLAINHSPSVESIDLLKFMLQNLSNLLTKDKNKDIFEDLECGMQYSTELFNGIFLPSEFFIFDQFQKFFKLFLRKQMGHYHSFLNISFFTKKFLMFHDSNFITEYLTDYTLENSPYLIKKSQSKCWQSFNFNKKETVLNNLKSQPKHKTKWTFRKQTRDRMFQIFQRSGSRFEWMILSHIPILPVNLRPIVTVGEGVDSVIIKSEINSVYSTIIYRAGWIIKMQQNKDYYPISLQKMNTLLLQQSVENLFGNPFNRFSPGFSEKSARAAGQFSILERLKGKFGRLRRQLLGKRVDYSGRSVIVVGPSLELNMCALPMEMGFQIFQPLLIRMLTLLEVAPSMTGAKRMISTSQPRVKECLQVLVNNELVLLNRAPTLHRMNFQTFYPIITEQKTILLHPLVCSSFNADFDGDQMAVHLPLSIESRLEARLIMMASHNILSPSTGTAIVTPTQDMVLGSYYLTLEPPSKYLENETYIFNLDEISSHLSDQKNMFHTWVWFYYSGLVLTHENRIMRPLEVRIYEDGLVWSIFPKNQKIDDYLSLTTYSFIGTTLGRVIFNKVIGGGLLNN